MLREQAKLFHRIEILVDFLTIIASFGLAYGLRNHLNGLYQPYNYSWILLIIIPTWYYLMDYLGIYKSIRTLPMSKVLVALVKLHVVGGSITASAIYFIEPARYSRGLFGFFMIFSFVLLIAEKSILKLRFGFMMGRGYSTRNILIIGPETKVLEFAKLVEQHADWGLSIAGYVLIRTTAEIKQIAGHRVLGLLDDLIMICKVHLVDEVVFCVPKEFLAEVENHLRDLEEMGITVRMVLDFYDTARSRLELSLFHDQIPIITFYSKAFDSSQLFLKRCLDIVGACVGLVMTGILYPIIALAIKFTSPGPILFSQERVGENGRIFRCWKFRSMYADAEQRKRELMGLNEMQGALFKIADDPRVTPIGDFLRKTSLDELPQFWNVLKGEMSLVGTRPPTPEEVEKYENWHRKRICIKPGITGLWQVSGRNQIKDFDEVVRLDLEYIDRWSLWLDIQLLVKTVWVVIARKGSC